MMQGWDRWSSSFRICWARVDFPLPGFPEIRVEEESGRLPPMSS